MHAEDRKKRNILVKHKKGLLDTADPCSRTPKHNGHDDSTVPSHLRAPSTRDKNWILFSQCARVLDVRRSQEKPKSITIIFFLLVRCEQWMPHIHMRQYYFFAFAFRSSFAASVLSSLIKILFRKTNDNPSGPVQRKRKKCYCGKLVSLNNK